MDAASQPIKMVPGKVWLVKASALRRLLLARAAGNNNSNNTTKDFFAAYQEGRLSKADLTELGAVERTVDATRPATQVAVDLEQEAFRAAGLDASDAAIEVLFQEQRDDGKDSYVRAFAHK